MEVRLVEVSRALLIGSCGLILLGAYRSEGLTIVPGMGVPGMIELGWNRSILKKHLEGGRARTYRNRERVRFTWHYMEFKDRDLRAYFDRIEDTMATTSEGIDVIWFGPSSGGRIGNGIRIGHATRADVYAIYGAVRDNPTADYDPLGLSFGFKYKLHAPYSPKDTVDEIWVHPPGSCL